MATGNFSSDVAGTPAVSVTGTNGAHGIDVTSDTSIAVVGTSSSPGEQGAGVQGNGTHGPGVVGNSSTENGVTGNSGSGNGVGGGSDTGNGVYGLIRGDGGGSGVYGESRGVHGSGVHGHRTFTGGSGLIGGGDDAGVKGTCASEEGVGVYGSSDSGTGVYGKTLTGYAGLFDGKAFVDNGDLIVARSVAVSGDILLTGADCAEEFDVSEAADVEPGIVMVINQDGALQPSRQAYDKRVAGVVSGAGNYRSGITLDKQPSQNNRSAIALVGKVYCKVDAQYAPIEVGDLLTTSPSHGYAMKATDPSKAFGAVIGKALSSLDRGCGLIPILVTLQ